MKAIVFHPEAIAELGAAIAYYEQQRSGLGLDLQWEVEQAINRIQQHPQSFPQSCQANLRQCLLRRFPYTLFYLERDAQIWIAAIAHQKRRPGYWRSRSPE